MSDHTLQVGDIVQLKSGGPVMTVCSVHETTARCAWFTTDGVSHGDTFLLEVLQPARQPVDYMKSAQEYVAEGVRRFREREPQG